MLQETQSALAREEEVRKFVSDNALKVFEKLVYSVDFAKKRVEKDSSIDNIKEQCKRVRKANKKLRYLMQELASIERARKSMRAIEKASEARSRLNDPD